MSSNAPYYQPATSGQYQDAHDPALTNYTTPADDFSRLAASLEQQAQADEDSANAQLVNLLQAATNGEHDPSLQDVHPSTEPYTPSLGKRKRTSETPGSQGDDAAKRAKQDPPHPSISAARAAGVHSAAALFRSPATGSAKKYTRPPMSKLYDSLRLTPEDFLHLQAAAKAYMLDPNYPGRQECVGNRAKGDNDMVKLKLFNCVRDFLAADVGERFFPEIADQGPNIGVDGPGFGTEETPQQRWVWPKDGNQIVSLVTPLMRRMVTNERQRQYAHESRKGGKNGTAGPNADGELLDPNLHEEQGDSPVPRATFSGVQQPQTQNVPRQQAHPPPPNCAQNVIQFIITYKDIKLLRFDWPNPDGTPRHEHMTFDKLTRTLSEHATGVRAALNGNGFLDPMRSFDFQPTKQTGLAMAKASEALKQAKQAQNDDEVASVGQTSPPPADLGEALRRELQAQSVESVSDQPHAQAEDASAYPPGMASLRLIGASVKAFTPSGFSEINSETEWNAVRDEVADCLWLEGCLRVAVEML